jgi:hypothetical protein
VLKLARCPRTRPRQLRRGAVLALLLCTASLCAPASGMALGAPPRRAALIVFIGADARQLAAVGGLSVGIMSASQGRYSATQLLLDIGQGARIATSAYSSSEPPPLSLQTSGGQGVLEGWPRARARAAAAPQELTPGLLAGQIPGGAGYAGSSTTRSLDGILAADRSGRVAEVSLGPDGTLVPRALALLARRRLVVADLPSGPRGLASIGRLERERPAGTLLIAVQRVVGVHGGELLWAGLGGLGTPGRELTSKSTQQRCLIVSVDLAPTILEWLGLPVPAEVRGAALETDGPLDAPQLSSLMARLHVLGGRRLRALAFLLCGWLVLALACSPSARARAWAMRTGALGVLWTPAAVMITAALEPSAAVEYATIAVSCMALGALSDLLLPWPRALIAPAFVVPSAITVDALTHGQLLMRSLMGPNPILGARFYGVGNELKSGLAVLVLAAVAAALHPGRRDRRAQAAMIGAGLVLGVIEGSARIGAGVGGVILVAAGFAVSVILLAPGAINRRRALLVLIAPVAGLVLLAAIDLASAHGGGHFTGSILHARSAGDVRDILVRRYKAAWGELHNHAMPVATALCLGLSILAVRRRERLLAPVGASPVWQAALAGGLAAGVAGALVEDSGPVLLVVAVFALGCVLSYLWGRPPRSPVHTPGRPLEARSHARRPPAAPARSGS